MELLLLLLERRGELVSREEIAQRLWGKDVFLDVDHGINTAVRKVRAALRDDPEKPRFVETVVGRGYRFAAPVTFGNGNSRSQEQAVSSPAQAGLSPAAASPEKAVFLRVGLLLGGFALIALVTIAWVLHRRAGSQHTVHTSLKSLAVLPLENLSGDPAQDYFADGMTEELIGRLSMIRGLRVISRTSVMRFQNTHISAPEIAKKLQVDALVEGSVLREGNRVRISIQLIRGATDEHIWAEEYDRQFRNILSLQEEVAQAIARKIDVAVSPPATLAGTPAPDPEAHEDYLKGRYYLNQRTEDALNRSIDCFQQAVAKDPRYALAYSGLADAYALLGFRGSTPSKDALSRAKAAALKAVALDDALASPHVSLAFIAETYEWNWAAAEREYKRALELNPDDSRAHHWYAGYLMYVGRWEEGIAEERRARDLDPVSLPVNNALAGRLLVAGRVDEALDQLRKTLEMDPHFAPAHQTLGWAYLNQGKFEQALNQFQQAVQLSGGDDKELMLDLGFAEATAGKREEARAILATFTRLHNQGIVPCASIGILYGALGETNQAFAWLQKAYAERDPELTYLKVPNRRFAPLRHDPRFQQLLAQVGLPN
jgi:TolB-like protein/DNA-binding winged helix-turn-helix (wHTH) protein/Flp pilus assembly protein TadD